MNKKTSIDFDWPNSGHSIKESDRFLPIANVARVMKKALPPHAKLSREAKECLQECVSEFILSVTSQAAENCEKKVLCGEDILWSMHTLGFENYAEALKIYLAKYRKHENDELNKEPPRKKPRAKLPSESEETL